MLSLPTECQCDNPGYCELMNREMHPVRWDECKNKPHYFEMFLGESGRIKNKPARVVIRNPAPRLRCIHLGEETGRIECKSCRGMVQVKAFACSVHETCTIGKPLDGIACCVGCEEYQSES